ncbi:acyl-CoA dehydrogenase family protein [Streptacidiphilus griseoplanus]|uniref:acyl-CoA dehydrogenase family protein n=1 Tax=Peterkaempfera griseoplana TaxID=66896 RepID=UPI0006E285C3|nr:acyl-CoA dehydrogenase family protein [Peterkaempfera griseoplana]
MNTTVATPSLQQARAAFDAVFAELAEGAGERDSSHENPISLVRALTDAGFGRLRVPVELGGFGVDLPTLFELLAQAGEADSNVPQILRGHFTTVEILRHAEDQETAAYWLRKVAGGAVFGNAQSELNGAAFETTTRAETVDGQHLVSGTKFYSTGSLYADYIRVAVADDQGNRWFAVIPARHPGVAHLDDWDGIGQRLTGSGTTVFDRVPVEEHGELGRYKEELRSLNSFVQLVHLANLTGIARSLVAETAAVVRGRSRTSLHALSEQATQDPDVLGVVGRLYAHRFTADAVLRKVSEALESAEAADTPEAFAQAYIETSAAQVALVDIVLEAANLAFHAGGSSTVRQRAHLDRHWRNARTLASHNPVIYKPRVIGDHVVNGAAPVNGYDRGRASAAADN